MNYLVIYIIMCSFLFPVSVTFNVDMQEQYINQDIFLAGADTLTSTSFGSDLSGELINPWTPQDIQLIDSDYDGIFSTTIDLDSNTVYAYKFLNGLFEYELNDESDRYVNVLTEDINLDIVCFDTIDESCENIEQTLIPVTFRVDMHQTQLTDGSVRLLGANESFTNFGYDIETENPIPVYDPSALELEDSDGDNVYSITILLDPAIVYQYKFVNGNDFSGVEQLQRSFIASEVLGYTLNEVCFNSEIDCEEFTTLINTLTFKTNVTNAILENGFELGEMLMVKWGYGETQPIERLDTLQLLPFSYNYKIDIDSVYVSEEAGLYYQYYKVIDDNEYRDVFFNFDYNGDDIVLAERRYVDFNETEDFSSISIEDTNDSNVDARRMPVFLNNQSIGEDVSITWTIDMRPAYYQILIGDTLFDIQGDYNVTNIDSLYQWGVWINGPASMPANGETWTQWGQTLQGTTSKKMWDDGTHGDVIADDHIYTIVLNYDSDASVAQECKFGIKGGDNESSYGLNHYENINISNPNIHVYWGSINPIFYNNWDYDTNIPINESCIANGDTNLDGITNVIDVVLMVNTILGNSELSDYQLCIFDLNSDEVINVVDIIALITTILG